VERPKHNRWTYTRTAATSVSFSWRVRLAWSSLPTLPLAFLLTGGNALPRPLLVFVGALTLLCCAWWWPQVWTRTAVPPAPAADRASDDRYPDVSTTAVDYFGHAGVR
jgi:hypothetical protein